MSMFYEYIFINLHLDYNHDIPLWTYVAQLFFAHSAYGYDRLMDVKRNETNNEELIDYVNHHTEQIHTTISLSILIGVICLFQNQHTIPLILPFLYSVFYYREFKKQFPLLKPFFICTLIITSSVIFPSVIMENNFNILKDINALIPPFANLYSSSNYLDIFDYDLDKANNITTLAVLYGNRTALGASVMANVISFVSNINHPNFNSNPINYLFQAQNIFSSINLFRDNQIDFRSSKKNGRDNDHQMSIMKKNAPTNLKPILIPMMRIPRCLPKLLV